MADSNFIDYLQRISYDYAESGQKACHTLMESAIKRLIRYKGKVVNFNQVDKEYLIGFIDFLNHDVNEFDSKKVMPIPGSRLSSATQASTRKSHSTSAAIPSQPLR